MVERRSEEDMLFRCRCGACTAKVDFGESREKNDRRSADRPILGEAILMKAFGAYGSLKKD